MKGRSHRDWFGLEAFEPGPAIGRGGACLYLLEDVPSTSDFLHGRPPAVAGRRCRWGGWGWQAEAVTWHRPPPAPATGTLAVARHQSRGKGRQGRRWYDCGGLHMSWVLRPDRALLQRGLAVWAGLMAAVALRERFGVAVGLKWPNDLLAGGRKLGGLLLETVSAGSSSYLVLGLGLNLQAEAADFPATLLGRATSLRQLSGRCLRPAQVAGPILECFGRQWPEFAAGGWTPFREAVHLCDELRGRRVTLGAGRRMMSGWARGIDDNGALVLETAAGRVHHLQAGLVHLEPPRVAPPGEEA